MSSYSGIWQPRVVERNACTSTLVSIEETSGDQELRRAGVQLWSRVPTQDEFSNQGAIFEGQHQTRTRSTPPLQY